MKTTGKITEANIEEHIFVVHKGVQKTDDEKIIATPFVITIENKNFVPVFSTLQNALETLSLCNNKKDVEFMKIDNQQEFINSIPHPIIRNPHMTADNKIKFELIILTETEIETCK